VKSHVGILVVGLVTLAACAARAQEPPPVPVTPVPQSAPPPVQSTPPPAVETPQAVQAASPAVSPAPSPTPVPLTPEQVRERRSAIFLMEGVLVNAVRLAAGRTAEQIQAVQPAPLMFTSAPAKAHGSYLESYGVFFHVEIPSVMPSVSSLVESYQRQANSNRTPAQQAAMATGGLDPSAIINPDAHYVESVKRQLLNAMLDHSNALDLRADEWLTVEAREAQETPGQISQPSTLILRVRGSDLADFQARRLTREEALKRVQVRGF
jgi:hypothetical protein